ncbi:MAG: right-handed parallel beta-helix repeat-containing protein [Phycisphaerae bacterium]
MRRLPALLAAAILLAAGVAPAGPAAAADAGQADASRARTYYVAPGGRDDATGRRPDPSAGKDGPLATLAAARDAARKAGTEQPRTIRLATGTYYLQEPLVLDARDSHLTISAAGGATPVLVGGRRITGWQPDGNGLWAADVSAVARGEWDFRMLMVDGRLCPRARMPKEGRFTHRSEFNVPWMSSTGGGWKRKPSREELTTLRYRPEDLEPWIEPENAEVTVYHMWDESLGAVKAIDRQANTLTFVNPLGHPPGAFGVKEYVVWNCRKGMHEPGQWYLDRKRGKVVYRPRKGEDMAEVLAVAPTVQSVIAVRGSKEKPVRGVVLRGLTVKVADTPPEAGGFGANRYPGAVDLLHTKACRIEKVTVTAVNGHGVRARRSDGLVVLRCTVRHVGAGGIYVRGDDTLVADNLVHHVGLAFPSGIGIHGRGKGARIVHNTVHETTYSAVNVSGEDVRIEANHLYRAMLVLHDGGGIYTFAPKRLVMRGNFIHDIPDTGGYGSSAYYLDERAEDCVVERNLSVRVQRPSHNHMAKNNTIRENVFIADGPMRLTFPRSEGFTFARNVLVAEGDITFNGTNAVTTWGRNVFFADGGKVVGQRIERYATKGTEALPADAALLADPKLLPGWEKGVVKFADDSPVRELGIEDLDVSSAGVRESYLPLP